MTPRPKKLPPEAERARRDAIRRYREDMLDQVRKTKWLEKLEDERTAGRRLPEVDDEA